MRIPILIAALVAAASVSLSQVSVRTGTFAFGKPALDVTGEFAADSRTGARGSAGTLTLNISNSGSAAARGVIVTISPDSALPDLVVVHVDSVDDITPGSGLIEKLTIALADGAPSQKGTLLVAVRADPGPVGATAKIPITLREIPRPRLTVGLLEKQGAIIAGEPAKVRVRIRNSGSGDARGVSATILPVASRWEGVILELGSTIPAGTIAQGTSKEIMLTLKPGARTTGAAAFVVKVDEERGQFSVVDTLSVPVKPAAVGAEEVGFSSYMNREYNKAIASLEKVVASGRASKEVYYALGYSYFKILNRPRSLTNMQKSASLGSPEAKAWLKERAVPVQIYIVTYTRLTSNLFEGYSPPVGLGVLPFTDSLMHDTPLTERLYNVLKAKNVSMRIFPYSTIRSEQVSWGLTTLAPSNWKILSALEKDLSMNFAVAGSVRDTLGSVLAMQVIRCNDGETVFSHEFRTTATSTAVDDAVMFLLNGRLPMYTKSRTLEIKIP